MKNKQAIGRVKPIGSLGDGHGQYKCDTCGLYMSIPIRGQFISDETKLICVICSSAGKEPTVSMSSEDLKSKKLEIKDRLNHNNYNYDSTIEYKDENDNAWLLINPYVTNIHIEYPEDSCIVSEEIKFEECKLVPDVIKDFK